MYPFLQKLKKNKTKALIKFEKQALIKFKKSINGIAWRCSFFTSLLFTSTPVSSFRFIDLGPAAVFVQVAYFFNTY